MNFALGTSAVHSAAGDVLSDTGNDIDPRFSAVEFAAQLPQAGTQSVVIDAAGGAADAVEARPKPGVIFRRHRRADSPNRLPVDIARTTCSIGPIKCHVAK